MAILGKWKVLTALFVCSLIPLSAAILDIWSFRETTWPLIAVAIGLGVCFFLSQIRPVLTSEGPRPRDLLFVAAICSIPTILLLPDWSTATGDEPHYLLTASSLVIDRDLDLAADYQEKRYLPYFRGFLSPHSKPGIDPATRYSFHGVGYPMILTPAVTAGLILGESHILTLARLLQIFIYCCFGMLLYWCIAKISSRQEALLGVIVTLPLGPLLFAPLAVFPETAAMAGTCTAFLLFRNPDSTVRVILGGCLIALLPWIAIKLIFVSAALLIVLMSRPSTAFSRRRLLFFVGLPVMLSIAAHGAFTWSLYESFSPASIYVGSDPSVGRHTARGTQWLAYFSDLPGAGRVWLSYWFDQKDGLLSISPLYLIAAAGIPWLYRHRRNDLLALFLLILAHSIPYALAQELGGASPPVRPLMPILWVLAIPVGVGLARLWQGPVGFFTGSLVCLSVCISVVLSANPGLLPHDYDMHMSRLLLSYSPLGEHVFRFFPIWANYEETQWTATLAWLLVALAVITVFYRVGQRRANESSVNLYSPALGAATTIILLAAVHVVIRGTVPVTDAHQNTELAPGVTAWVAARHPEMGWLEPKAIWTEAEEPLEVVLTSNEAIKQLTISLRSLVDNEVFVSLGGTEDTVRLSGGESVRYILSPISGHSHKGGYAYRLLLQSSDGEMPAVAVGGADYRMLGVNLTILEAAFEE